MLVSKFCRSIVLGSARCHKASKNLNFIKQYSSSSKPNHTVHIENGVATLVMQRHPVNSLNLEHFKELRVAITELENNKDVKGLVVTSGCPGIFSAGLDILELYKVDKQRFREFWTALQDFYMTLYTTPLVTMAAVNGHAIAGGFQVMVSCDYRIAVNGPFKMGLNETLLGLTAPEWFMNVLVSIVGHRKAELALQTGQLFSPEQALALGMIDEIASNEEELNSKIKAAMTKWLKVPEWGRRVTKAVLRNPSIDHWKQVREQELQRTLDYALQEQTQKLLQAYLDQLKKKK